ncbi:MAG: phosphoglycerate dehydrogenase [Candidatus Omnitrophota bacterium]
MMKKVLIGPSTFATADRTPVDKLVKSGFEVVNNPFGRKLAPEELTKLLPGVSGIIAGLETLDRKTLEGSDLKVISRCGAGMSNVDIAAASGLGIKVFNTPDAPTNAVAELAVGGMICLMRHISRADKEMHAGKWPKKIGAQVEGKTITIIGYGRIGRRVAKLLKPFEVKIIAVEPNVKGPTDGIPVLSIGEALPRSDVVTIHTSGDDVVLGPGQFALMKKGALLMNCARGAAIDEGALMNALDSGAVAGAWLDCFRDEPYNGPLVKYPQVLLTPHIGSYTVECRRRMEMEAVDNLIGGFGEV